MGIIDKLKNEVCYFRFELNEDILERLSLDSLNKYVYARMFNHGVKHNLFFGLFLCGVYDLLTDKPLDNISTLKEYDFLFNQKISFKPPSRGTLKWTLIDKEPLTTLKLEEVLPHMVFTHFVDDDNEIIDYFKDGIYTFYPNTNRYSTEYKNIKHLEDKAHTDTFELRERVYLELLKQQKKEFTEKELKDFLLIIKKDKWVKMNERQRRVSLRDFIFTYKQPIYKEIPKEYRERAINEIK